MLSSKGIGMGPISPLFLGSSHSEWVSRTRLLGMTVDEKLSWIPHTLEIKKSFVTKLDLLKRSRFLPKNILRDFYFKEILPSVKYGLVVWGACSNSDIFKFH